MTIQQIIVGTDFSPESEAAAQHALHIARSTGASITLVHACPIVEPPSRSLASEWMTMLQKQQVHSQERLVDMCARMSGQGPQVSYELVEDAPDAALTDRAAALGADLVVVGTHGFSGMTHLLLGSVAEKVIRHSPTSAMVARPGESASAGYRKILVAMDFSDSAEHALDMATALAAEGARIHVWHWWHSPYGGPVPEPEALRQEIEGSTRAAGEALVERFRSPRCGISFHTAEAPTRLGIQHELASGAYDLVVTGSHGRRGITRWLLGSVAESTARHAPCSVLVARRPPAK
jgi:nucleotide-binding universal stress UspA family protein